MPRDSSGNYTLPPGNPVIDGTVIDVNWANPTLSDVAVQMNNLLTRDGLLGATAPIKFNDGTLALPGITWASETTMGIYRPGANTMALAIQGVARQTWTPTGTTISVPLNLTGDLSTTGRIGLPNGLVGTPSLYFTSNPDTGLYTTGADIAFTADGLQKMVIVNASVQVKASTVLNSPSMVLAAGTNAGGAGFALDIVGSGVGLDVAKVRFLNNAYTIERLAIWTDSTQSVIMNPGAFPLVFGTSNTTRLAIDASGNARFTGPMAAAPNFWVGETTAAAGTVGISGGLGSSSVYWGNTSAGGGQLSLNTGAGLALNLNRIPGSVNYFQMQQSTPGVGLLFSAEGSDANVVIGYVAKGNGSHNFYSGSTGSGLQQFQIQGIAASSRFISVGGSNGANPFITTNTGGIEMRQNVYGTSAAGANPSLANVSTSVWSTLTNELLQFYQLANGSDNRPAEIRWAGGVLYFRVLNDGYSNAVNWLTATGGFGTGISAIQFSMSTAGVAGTVVQQMVRAGSNFNVGIGAVAPTYQFNVLGTGQSTVAIFDLASTSATNGATIYLGDQGSAGGNGGCIMFGAFPTPTAAGKHFASIRGYITDASNNTAGELRFNTKDTSADTGSTQCLRLTAGKVIYDNRDLPIARDAGAAPASGIPIGGIVMANVGAVVVNALATINAATNNLTVHSTSAGTNQTINSGTWRNLGARDTSTGFALWIRTA